MHFLWLKLKTLYVFLNNTRSHLNCQSWQDCPLKSQIMELKLPWTILYRRLVWWKISISQMYNIICKPTNKLYIGTNLLLLYRSSLQVRKKSHLQLTKLIYKSRFVFFFFFLIDTVIEWNLKRISVITWWLFNLIIVSSWSFSSFLSNQSMKGQGLTQNSRIGLIIKIMPNKSSLLDELGSDDPPQQKINPPNL